MIIKFDKKAKKYIESCDKPTKDRIKNGIIGLTQSPPVGDIKALQSFSDGRMRLRIGKYRIIFRYINESAVVILHIMDVNSRGDIYK